MSGELKEANTVFGDVEVKTLLRDESPITTIIGDYEKGLMISVASHSADCSLTGEALHQWVDRMILLLHDHLRNIPPAEPYAPLAI